MVPDTFLPLLRSPLLDIPPDVGTRPRLCHRLRIANRQVRLDRQRYLCVGRRWQRHDGEPGNLQYLDDRNCHLGEWAAGSRWSSGAYRQRRRLACCQRNCLANFQDDSPRRRNGHGWQAFRRCLRCGEQAIADPFARDTLVATPEGPRAIGEMEPGEFVLAYQFEPGNWLPRRVVERHDSLYNGPLLTITTDRGPVRTTMYHPFWVLRGHELANRSTPRELDEREDQGLSLDGRWVNSHELLAGDVLIGHDGRPRRVLRIEQESSELFPVSNLTVEDDHTFAVGPDALLVHNTGGCGDVLIFPGGRVTPELLSQIQQPGQRLSSQLVTLIRQRAGFADEGVPLIIDSNNMRRGIAEALRAEGYNARTVSEIFGVDPGDPAIASLAQILGGRVLTNNMTDFDRIIGIQIDPRATRVETWIGLIEAGLR